MARRLVAILAADVVGYSRLMAADEAGTHARLKALRQDFIEPKIAEHHGRIAKLMGDGALVEFASVVDAVECAAAVQAGVAEHQATLPEEQRIAFRIGLNIGDVIIEGDDIYGDGVNVAARLEQLAGSGEICVSRTVYDHARSKVKFGFEPTGEHRVKNIPEPVVVYRVVTGPRPLAKVLGLKRAGMPSRAWTALAAVVILVGVVGATAWLRPWPASFALPWSQNSVSSLPGPSIAVLPFENLSGDPQQEYFSDGVSEDIITDLSKISGLLVIARQSSFKFKGQLLDVREVARNLGVRYVLEGSTRRFVDRVRINAQLIEAATGTHLWAERYDRPLRDVFALQDQITEQIVAALQIELTQSERERVTRRYTDDLQAYDHFLMAKSFRSDLDKANNERSRRLLEQAIELDPNFAAAYAELSWSYHQAWFSHWSANPEDARELALQLAQKAVALDASLPEAHARLAWVYVWRGQYEDAMTEGREAIALDPNYADGYLLLSHILIYAGEPEEGMRIALEGMPLDPDSLYHNLMHLADGQWMTGRYDEAIANLKRSVSLRPDFMPGYLWLAAINAHLGRDQEAQAAAAEVLRLSPQFSIAAHRAKLPYKDPAVVDRFLNGLRKAGLPEGAATAPLQPHHSGRVRGGHHATRVRSAHLPDLDEGAPALRSPAR